KPHPCTHRLALTSTPCFALAFDYSFRFDQISTANFGLRSYVDRTYRQLAASWPARAVWDLHHGLFHCYCTVVCAFSPQFQWLRWVVAKSSKSRHRSACDRAAHPETAAAGVREVHA